MATPYIFTALTGVELVNRLRMRLNDTGDDNEVDLVYGSLGPCFYWSDNDLILALNAAIMDLMRVLMEGKAYEELRALVGEMDGSGTGSDVVPADCFKPLAAVFTDTSGYDAAKIIDDPTNVTEDDMTIEGAIHLYGKNIRTIPPGHAFRLMYWRIPEPILFNEFPLTDFQDDFYTAILPLAEFYAILKDDSEARLQLSRNYRMLQGEEEITMADTIRYIQSSAGQRIEKPSGDGQQRGGEKQ